MESRSWVLWAAGAVLAQAVVIVWPLVCMCAGGGPGTVWWAALVGLASGLTVSLFAQEFGGHRMPFAAVMVMALVAGVLGSLLALEVGALGRGLVLGVALGWGLGLLMLVVFHARACLTAFTLAVVGVPAAAMTVALGKGWFGSSALLHAGATAAAVAAPLVLAVWLLVRGQREGAARCNGRLRWLSARVPPPTRALIWFALTGLALVLVFAIWHRAIYLQDPLHFRYGAIAAAEYANFWDFVYFSWVTLAHLGHSDLAPDNPLAQLLVMVEALIGILLVVAFLGIMLHRALRRPDPQPAAWTASVSHVVLLFVLLGVALIAFSSLGHYGIHRQNPDHYRYDELAAARGIGWWDFVYFAWSTSTSLGHTDIAPQHPLPQVMVMAQTLIGVVLAMLCWVTIFRLLSRRGAPPADAARGTVLCALFELVDVGPSLLTTAGIS